MFLSGGKAQKKKVNKKRAKKRGGFATYMHQNGVHYSCEKLDTPHHQTSSTSGGDSASSTQTPTQTTQSTSGGTQPVIEGGQSGGGLKEQKKLFKK